MRTGDMVKITRGNLEFYEPQPGGLSGLKLGGMLYEPCHLLVLASFERGTPFVKVLTPDGKVGWVHACWVETMS